MRWPAEKLVEVDINRGFGISIEFIRISRNVVSESMALERLSGWVQEDWVAWIARRHRFGNSLEVRREGGIFGEKTAADVQVFSLGLSRKAVGILEDMVPKPAKNSGIGV